MNSRGESAEHEGTVDPFQDPVEALVAECIARAQAEGDLPIEELCLRFPDLASQIRERIKALKRVGLFRADDPLSEHAPPLRKDAVSFFRRSQREKVQVLPGLEAGKVIGDFRLTSLIDQGGMAQVWQAEQLSLGCRRVALKFVRPERVTEHQLQLLAREARAGARLSHPGIVTVYGYGQSDGQSWIAMEFVEGAWTLRDFLDDALRLAELPAWYDRDVARLVAEIAEAMQAAHEMGVIHRDLKPQNVLITPEDRPKVADFGLARITDEAAISQTGEFAGTYFYMSPEQVAAKRMGLDHRTDVFSLGVLLYELLALQRPFKGDTSHQVAEQIVTKDPPDLRTIRSRIPRDLAVICGKALEKDRDKRFQTMKEFAADLRRYLGNEPLHAQPPTVRDRAVKWIKRNPTKSVAAGIAAVAFATTTMLLAANVRANAALKRTNQDLTIERANLKIERSNLAQQTGELEVSNKALATKTAEAERRFDEVLRLSALQDYDDLIEAADALWPPYPRNIDGLRAWIGRANELVNELPVHRAKRDELRADALPQSEEERRAERESHPDFSRLQAVGPEIERLAELLVTAASDEEASKIEAELGRLEEEQRMLEAKLSERRNWQFPEGHAQARWWNIQLTKLIEELEEVVDPKTGLLAEAQDAVSPEHGWSVPRRLASAERLRDEFAAGGEFEERWQAMLPEIRGAYPGLDLSPQMALVPIGPDPDSGLWEFWHIATGTEPLRDPNTGHVRMEEASGVVLVLLPGGSFLMGAQTDPSKPNFDPQAQPDEAPVHEVRLSAFFLSKYEMTQGQWLRMCGLNPSFFGPLDSHAPTLLHPVEQVRWIDGTRWLHRIGLSLPNEAQWEYGARGGTETPWWTGRERGSLLESHAANLADQAAARLGATWQDIKDWPELDDGYAVHAPVGAYSANPFGLHEVHGNVWEWCLDGYDSDFYAKSPPMDPLSPWESASHRVARGGGFYVTDAHARSAGRDAGSPSFAGNELGLRPARALDP